MEDRRLHLFNVSYLGHGVKEVKSPARLRRVDKSAGLKTDHYKIPSRATSFGPALLLDLRSAWAEASSSILVMRRSRDSGER